MAPFRKGQTLYFYDNSTNNLWRDEISFIRKPLLFFENYQAGGQRVVDNIFSTVFNINYSGLLNGQICEKSLSILNKKFALNYQKNIMLHKYINTYYRMQNNMLICKNSKPLIDSVISKKEKMIKSVEYDITKMTLYIQNPNKSEHNLKYEHLGLAEEEARKLFIDYLQQINEYQKDIREIQEKALAIL